MPTIKVKSQKSKVRKVDSASRTRKSKTGLTVDVLDTKGKAIKTIDLPREIFSVAINKPLMTQAVHVYLVNKRQGTVSTKTRAEVEGSRRKIYQQKGTGRARHGAKSAPIFVHGGVAHGPKPREFLLTLSKPMRKKALFSALSFRLKEGHIVVISKFSDLPFKTKEYALAFENLGLKKSKQVLLVVPKVSSYQKVIRSVRNIVNIKIFAADVLNTYEVLRASDIVFMDESISVLYETFIGKKD